MAGTYSHLAACPPFLRCKVMSVLASKRKISNNEFDHTFKIMYQYLTEQLIKAGKRKKKWICDPIYGIINEVYCKITDTYTGFYEKEERKEKIQNLFKECAMMLLRLQSYLYVFWCIQEYDTRKMEHCCSLINDTIYLINQKIGYDDRRRIMILNLRSINEAEFLKNMRELVRVTCSHVIRTPIKYDDSYTSLLFKNVNNAWVLLLRANSKIPTNADEYNKRKNNISKAISCLMKSQCAMYYVIAISNISEESLRRWMGLFSTELKLLYGLQKADKERFGNLT